MSGAKKVPTADTIDNTDVIDNAWFEDDDEETLNMLLSKAWLDDLPSRLESRLENLAQRFRHDVDPTTENSFWRTLNASAKEHGFVSNIPAVTASTDGSVETAASVLVDYGSPCGCPSPFETNAGKKHVRAVASFLKVSEHRAIQLTMSALRTIHGSDSSRTLLSVLSTLLSTFTLLHQVVDYYYAQRLFRLCVIAECLRIEQDTAGRENSFLPFVSNLLNSLDNLVRFGDGRHRGLFRRLLTVACAPHIPPTLIELAPALELQADSQQFLASAPQGRGSTTVQRRWNQFISDCVEASRFQRDLERSEAMEVLIVLLYERIQDGVQRDDYVCLILAFQSLDFFVNFRDGMRLSQQAGMMCAECTSLWRLFSTKPSEYDGPDWVFNHPLLLGLFDPSGDDSDAAVSELESLLKLVRKLGEHALERSNDIVASRNANVVVMNNPESLAVLSFGLLLSQSFHSLLKSSEGSDANAYWQTFRITGIDLVKTAGNQYGALDFLQSSLDSLIEAKEVPARIPVPSSQAACDWLLDDAAFPITATDSENAVNAMSIAYSSLGREVLAALVATLQDTALSLDHPGAASNIGMLCDLAAAVFRNEPTFCEPFLAEWSIYASPSKDRATLPLCFLMDAASKLAAAAVNHSVHDQTGMDNHFFLPSIAPLLRFVSSLCYNSDVVESVLNFLPAGLIREAFLHTKKTYQPTEDFTHNRIRVLGSINTLVRIGDADSCRRMLMNTLEVEGSISVDAPCLVLGTIDGSDDSDALPYVLSITAGLLQSSYDEPRWALNVSSTLLVREAMVSLSRILSSGDTKLLPTASLVLLALCESFSSVMVCHTIAETEKSQYLEQVMNGILASFGVLTSSLASLGQILSFSVVETILEAISSFLTQLRTILQLNSKLHVAAADARDVIINALVVNSTLGESIAYFSVAPISLHFSALMDAVYQRERSLGCLTTQETGKPSDPGAGLRGNQASPLGIHLKTVQAFSEQACIHFDVEAWKTRKWIEPSDQNSIFGAASAAVRVLMLWASHIENMVAEKHGSLDRPIDLNCESRSELLALSPQDLLSSLVIAPPLVRKNAILSEVWSFMEFSNVELLMQYLKVSDDSKGSTLIPTVAVLDLLSATVAHLKLSEAKIDESTMFQVLGASPYIRPILWQLVLEIRDLFHKDELAMRPAIQGRLRCCLRVLRVLRVAVDKKLVLIKALVENKKSDIIQELFDCVREIVTIMERTPMEVLCHDDAAILKLRLATGCLCIIRSIRESVHSMHAEPLHVCPFSSVTMETNLLRSLWRVLARFASTVNANEWKHTTPQRSKSIILSFFAVVVNIFTTEIVWWFQNKEQKSEILTDLFRKGVDPTSIVQRFTRFSGFGAFLIASERMFAECTMISTSALLSFQNAPSMPHESDFCVWDDSFDVFSIPKWFLSVLPIDTDRLALIGLIANVAAAKAVFANECYLLEALVQFSGIYILMQDHDGVALARSSLQWLRLNAEAVETHTAQQGHNSLQSEMVDMAVTWAGLTLNAVNMTSSSFDAGALTELLVDLSDGCRHLFALLGISSGTSEETIRKVCQAQQCLLASAITVRRCLDAHSLPNAPMKEISQSDQIDLALTEVACKVLSLLERLRPVAGNLVDADRNVFYTCTALMRTVLARKASSEGVKAALDSFIVRFSQVLREYKVVQLFVLEAHRASELVVKTDTSAELLESPYHGEQSYLRVVATVVGFLRAMVESRHPDLLSLISDLRTAELFTQNPMIAFASGAVWKRNDLHQRGYLPSRLSSCDGASSEGVARDDPVHKLWISMLQTMTPLLCISRCGARRDPSSDYFAEIAVDFINANKLIFNACLDSSAARPLTLNILKEASNVLSLLSEACASESPSRIHPDLHRELSSALTGTVACISTFLGASGAARELFRVLESLDSTGDVWNAPSLTITSTQSTHPLLAAGVPNARHEGIRYAHFAFQCIAVMTHNDYKDSSVERVNDQSREPEPSSPSNTERKGRNTINSGFHNQMEQTAAECLLNALLVVWRLHPAASSFALLLPGASFRAQAWSLVKPGMLIAYRFQSDTADLSFVPEKMIRVARVHHVDTVQRSWHVHVVKSGSDEACETDDNVHLSQLVGIENIDKRKCLFQYLPAPDSAAELENFANSTNLPVTVGHLILVLRWCHQQNSPAASKPLVQKVAEVSAAILGAEVSLYRLIGAGDFLSSKRIADQLLSLFGDFNSSLPNLSQVLSSSVLKAAQAQLDPELKQALFEMENKKRKQTEINLAALDVVGFGGVRRSSSAFRGLRVPLE